MEKVKTRTVRSPRSETALLRLIPRRRIRRSLVPYLAFLFGLLPFVAIFSPAQVHPTEYQVKAAYLYNFGKFVRWQADHPERSETLGICILGKDPFGKVLDATVAGESINGRKISVYRLLTMQESSPCGILFVSGSEEGRLGPILEAAQKSEILTVSDMPEFTERGGTIGLVMQGEKIRFEVNREAAEKSHLILGSELLKVASKVIGQVSP